MTLARSTPLVRTQTLRARRWGARPVPKKASWRDAFLADRRAAKAPKLTPYERTWMAFVRSLGCCCAHLGGCRGAVQASHVALSADVKGMGMKVPTASVVPHCDRHHRAWDGRLGNAGNPFAGMSKDARYELAAEWIDDVHEAATPGDSRDHADELEALGLGKVIGNGRDGWSWLPGHLVEAGTDELLTAAARLVTA